MARGSCAAWRRRACAACYTDFYLATKINFLSGERVACSAKLGPTTTEYFFEYRAAVDAAPEAALVAVNPTAAEKLERRLERLGVTYERRDLDEARAAPPLAQGRAGGALPGPRVRRSMTRRGHSNGREYSLTNDGSLPTFRMLWRNSMLWRQVNPW